jgi:DNA-binding transcriptional MocR family regulator
VAALVPELSYYVSSFSKAITPALRTAFVVAPTSAHATRVSRQLQATGWIASPIMAEIAARVDLIRHDDRDRC